MNEKRIEVNGGHVGGGHVGGGHVGGGGDQGTACCELR